MTPVLRLINLTQAAAGRAILDRVSLTLAARERLAVIGPSGGGKTTLLRLIAGIDPPANGEIAIAGRIASSAGKISMRPEHRGVAMVFQGLALFPHLRALDQIAFAAKGRGGLTAARILLERVGLGNRANARLEELSGGERQRIALARALAQRPAILLMDEPFASLDDVNRETMRNLLRSLLEESDTATILVTHLRDDALDLAEHVLILERGVSVVQGPLESVIRTPSHPAAVTSLGLGQLIEGSVVGGVVQTALGPIAAPKSSEGNVHLLIRPGQCVLSENDSGPVLKVQSITFRTSGDRARDKVAVCRLGTQILHVNVGDAAVVTGQEIRVEFRGDVALIPRG